MKEWLSFVQKEVVAGKHLQRKGSIRLITPRFEITATHPVILQTSKGGDRAIERRLGCIDVCFVYGEICSQDWKHDLHEFYIFQHFSRNAIQAT